MTLAVGGGTIGRMELIEVDEAGHRLHLGPLESPRAAGYTAALAVQRLDARPGAEVLFRDDRLACGHRFATADDALVYALRQGRAWLRARRAVGRRRAALCAPRIWPTRNSPKATTA